MIKVITEPSVYLVGHSSHSYTGILRFLGDEGVEDWQTDADSPGDTLVEAAGRLCYMSFKSPRPGGNHAYIGHLLEVGHGSVLEHAVYSLIITGVSRSLTHELVRHRAGFGFSQLSQRYVDESDVAFVVPPALENAVKATMEHLAAKPAPHTGEVYLDRDWMFSDGDREIGHHWLEACEYARRRYVGLVKYLEGRPGGDPDKTVRRKSAREAARSVLPNATETKIFVTGNARAWRNFIDQRAVAPADAEIRRLAVAVLRVLQAESRAIFGDYAIEPCPLGGEMASSPHRKV